MLFFGVQCVELLIVLAPLNWRFHSPNPCRVLICSSLSYGHDEQNDGLGWYHEIIVSGIMALTIQGHVLNIYRSKSSMWHSSICCSYKDLIMYEGRSA
jgi:hypothetical protein